eukprot:365468-Chlamydomonas_euryale.AAC.9
MRRAGGQCGQGRAGQGRATDEAGRRLAPAGPSRAGPQMRRAGGWCRQRRSNGMQAPRMLGPGRAHLDSA